MRVFRVWQEEENSIVVNCLNAKVKVEVCIERLADHGFKRTREAVLKQARRMREEGRTTSIFEPAVPHSARNQWGHFKRRTKPKGQTGDHVAAAAARRAKADAASFLGALADFERPPATLNIPSSGTGAAAPTFVYAGSGCSCALGD